MGAEQADTGEGVLVARMMVRGACVIVWMTSMVEVTVKVLAGIVLKTVDPDRVIVTVMGGNTVVTVVRLVEVVVVVNLSVAVAVKAVVIVSVLDIVAVIKSVFDTVDTTVETTVDV